MSQEELLAAYLDGRMSRRSFVRRLVAGGVSLGAAIAYAHELEPSAAEAHRRLGGFHFNVDLSIVDQDLDTVVDRKGVRVKLISHRTAGTDVDMELYLIRDPDHTDYPHALVGTGTLATPGAGAAATRIALDFNPPYSLKAVKKERRRRGKARFQLNGNAHSPGKPSTFTGDVKTITT
jgi:hypothetical protein